MTLEELIEELQTIQRRKGKGLEVTMIFYNDHGIEEERWIQRVEVEWDSYEKREVVRLRT